MYVFFRARYQKVDGFASEWIDLLHITSALRIAEGLFFDNANPNMLFYELFAFIWIWFNLYASNSSVENDRESPFWF